jgi:crotonobetainyl-CoA:carnitine CoA-transferase CaiB-like acyl-CoA transferase
MSDGPLAGIRVVSIATNLPGPVAASRLSSLGAAVTKVEPPAGDPLALAVRGYYDALVGTQTVVTLDLKSDDGRAHLRTLLGEADVLLTSHRPAALHRLGLGWARLHDRHPRLSQVAIVGRPAPDDDVPGHDLTYQASAGLLAGGPDEEPRMPVALVADLTGAERAATEALAALLERDRTGVGSYREVALSDAADAMAAPLRHRLTGPLGPLGGSLPGYRIYAAADGYVACAALEPHFFTRLTRLLGVDGTTEDLEAAFQQRTVRDWQDWGAEHDVPLAAVVTDREP